MPLEASAHHLSFSHPSLRAAPRAQALAQGGCNMMSCSHKCPGAGARSQKLFGWVAGEWEEENFPKSDNGPVLLANAEYCIELLSQTDQHSARNTHHITSVAPNASIAALSPQPCLVDRARRPAALCGITLPQGRFTISLAANRSSYRHWKRQCLAASSSQAMLRTCGRWRNQIQCSVGRLVLSFLEGQRPDQRHCCIARLFVPAELTLESLESVFPR